MKVDINVLGADLFYTRFFPNKPSSRGVKIDEVDYQIRKFIRDNPGVLYREAYLKYVELEKERDERRKQQQH